MDQPNAFCNVPAGESGYSLNSDNKCTKTVSSTYLDYDDVVNATLVKNNEGRIIRYTCPTGYRIIYGGCARERTSSTAYTGNVSTKTTYSWTETYSSTRRGNISGRYIDPTTGTRYTKTVGYSRTFTGRRSCSYATGHDAYPTSCGAASHRASGRTPAQAKALVEGTKPAATPTPGFSPPTKPADHANISNIWLLGKYHTQHPDRTNLAAASTSDRDTAATNLGSLSAGNIATAATGATYTPQNIANLYVPTSWTGTTAASRRSDLQTETNDYKTAYTTAYNNAYSQATADMGSTATTSTWSNLDWRYQTSTLAWGSYQEDPATTYSGWVAQAGETEAEQTDHCFSGAFANTANIKIAVFDDTAHSAMNLVYLEKDPADTSGITLLASGGALTADPAVAYPGDSAQSGRFYGTTYSMPI